MYSDKQSVLEVVALLCAHGVEHAVVCAGSRSSPLAHSLAVCPKIRAHPCVDERSGAFEALGICQATGRPVAVCVTSGSALLDAAPAICEAYYQELPLVLLSADRPAAWIDQLDGQTMRQENALANFVRKSVSLPLGKNLSPDGDEGADQNQATAEEHWHINRLVNEALLAAQGPVPGPVHINIPLAEPLFSFTRRELPVVRTIRRHFAEHFELPEDALDDWSQSRRILLVLGQMRPGTLAAEDIAPLAGACPVVAEHLANADDLLAGTDGFVARADSVLAAQQTRDNFEPDLVITLGGHIVSKRLKRFLRGIRGLRHWHVSPDGAMPDVFTHLERIFAASPKAFLKALNKAPCPRQDPAFTDAWRQADKRAGDRLRTLGPLFSDVRLLGAFFRHMPPSCALHLANSLVVRNAQFHDLPTGTRVFCNRGVNGIDGSLSATLGNALVLETKVFCCIGDLSFFYDRNALWRETLPHNLHILLFNNGEGNIFRTLAGLASPFLRSHIAGANNQSAQAVAQNAGLAYLAARTLAEFDRVLPAFCESDSSCLLEVFTDAGTNAEDLALVNSLPA